VHIAKVDRTLEVLKSYVKKIVNAIFISQNEILSQNKNLLPIFKNEVVFLTAQELENMYPDLEMKKREEEYAKKCKGLFFLIGIG
jgi:aspartate--ammonia ligase